MFNRKISIKEAKFPDWVVLLIIIGIFVGVTVINLFIWPVRHHGLETEDIFFEGLIMLFWGIAFWLWARALEKSDTAYIALGLGVLYLASVLDVADEFFSQPRLISDLDQLVSLIGMVLFIIAIYAHSSRYLKLMTKERDAKKLAQEISLKYRTLFEQANDAVFLETVDGKILEVNQKACDLLGYTRDELTQMTVSDIVPPDHVKQPFKMHENKTGEYIEAQNVRKDGSLVPVEVSISLLDIDNEKFIYAIVRDITSRKRTQEAIRENEERLRTLINAMPDIVCFKDGEGKWMEANDAILQLFHLKGIHYQEKKDTELTEYAPFFREAFEKCEETDELAWQQGTVIRGDEIIPQPDGSEKIFDVIKVPLFYPDGRRKGLVILGHEITERVMAEKALRESERKFRSIVEQSADGIVITDEQGRILEWNQSQEKITGITQAEALDKTIWEVHHLLLRDEDRREKVVKQVKDGLHEFRRQGDAHWVNKLRELEITRLDGKQCTIQVITFPITTADGFMAGSICRDITERKESELALRESQERLNLALQGAELGMWDWNVKDNKSTINQRWAEIIGYTVEEFLEKYPTTDEYNKLIHPDDRDIVSQALNLHFKGKASSYQCEYRLKHKTGEWIWILDKGKIVERDEKGRPVRLIGTHLDITEHKQSEEALQKSEALLAEAQSIAALGSWSWSSKDGQVCWTKEMYHIFGISESETPQTLEDYLKFVHPHDVEMISRKFNQTLAKRENVDIEYRIIRPDGEERYIHGSTKIFSDKKSKAINVIGIALDITDRKKAEEALRESEEKYRNLIDQSQDAIYLLCDNKFEIINKKFVELFGYTQEETNAPSFNFMNLIAPESRPFIEKRTKKILRGERVSPQYEFTALTKYGKKIEVETSVSYIKYQGKMAVQGILRNITQRKRIEKRIKDSLREKEILLKEIHHRVKNNLQVISSLLYLQSKYTKYGSALSILKESQNRVRSMALVHEKLYKSNDLANINFSEYIKEFVNYLFRTYLINVDNVKLKLNIQKIPFDIDTAIPCGLILNELVSNAMKYAFPEGRKGEIYIGFKSDDKGKLELVVSDNGVGLPRDSQLINKKSLGLELVKSLVEQIDGELEVCRDKGTTYKITFYKQKLIKEISAD